VRLGVTLPQFRADPAPALAVARRAEAAGLDGVFVFDHLWPLHKPDQPALHCMTLLGALSAETERVTLGSFMARVSLLPDAVLVHTLHSLHRMLDGRFIAGLGTGDSENRGENIAYGLGFPPAVTRMNRLVDCCRRLRAAGVPTWVGGTSERMRRTAAEEADGWNGWGVTAEEFAAMATELPDHVEKTWGGQVLIGRTASEAAEKLERHGTKPGLVHGTVDDLCRHLSALQDAGASWAVCSPLDIGTEHDAVELLVEASQ
jgi:alkanesulfonate monooxygenase SsuD/methylene tetrahydromethanopterin reductase-like flavin-dependent oxidoreductase (luciferase family)